MKVSLLFFLFSLSLQAETIRGKIESVDQGQKESPHLIFLENGLVLFLESSKADLFNSILISSKSNRHLEFEIDRDHNVLSILNPENNFLDDEIHILSNSPANYEPTVLNDQESAYFVFDKMRDDYKEDSGQCFNRAHIWAYEEYVRTGTRSMKLFMFFTNKYIRKNRFPWWFHVAPAVLALTFNQISRLILDRRYTTFPMPTKEWTDHFIGTGRACEEVNKLSEYHRTSKVEDCYLIETSMFFWQPRDIRLRDTKGRVKTNFNDREIKHALKEAF